MATAIVLLNVDAQNTAKIAETVAAIPGVTEALADIVTEKIRGVPGIRSSQTLIAFRAYSPFDLAAMFDID